MKINTITCHDCYNLGATLQAYALQNYLESIGHEAKIIHYKPDYLSGHYKLWTVTNSVFNKPLVKQLYLLAKLPGRLLALKRKKVFDDFTSKYLNLTRRYNSYEELRSDAPEADAYIAGSDQIWNTLFQNGRDAAFYLDFGLPNIKRISYAASFATQHIIPQYREFVIDKLKNFNFVSIREKTSLPLLYSLGRTDGISVCDPVFLLSKEQWLKIIDGVERLRDKYLLVYLTSKSKEVEKIAIEMSKSMRWKIFVVGSFKVKYAHRNFVNAGPLEFIRLINDAQFVISNSFHATAFSLIMERNFCVVIRAEDINERMKSVLHDYDLDGRLVNSYTESLIKDIDYQKVNKVMKHIIAASKQWLNESLES